MAQTIVNINKTVRDLGSSGYAGLKKQFPASPILFGIPGAIEGASDIQIAAMTDAAIVKNFGEVVTRGTVLGSNAYWGFGTKNMDLDYKGPGGAGSLFPAYYNFQAGKDETYVPGTPINSFVPNMTSPPSPDVDPQDQPEPSQLMRNWANGAPPFSDRRGSAPFVGEGTNLSPAQAGIDLVAKALAKTKLEVDALSAQTT